jgi:hypothetical protein
MRHVFPGGDRALTATAAAQDRGPFRVGIRGHR